LTVFVVSVCVDYLSHPQGTVQTVLYIAYFYVFSQYNSTNSLGERNRLEEMIRNGSMPFGLKQRD